MALTRLRKLARRARNKLGNKDASQSNTNNFDWTQDRAFAYLDEDADSAFKLVGAALVGTWEVAIADIARALDQRLPEAQRTKLVDRISDSLVPVQTPLQDTGRRFRTAIKTGLQAALQSHQLTDATTPLMESLAPLPAAIEEGWLKTTEYLEPVFEVLPDSPAARSAFVETGPALRAMVEKHNAKFNADMAALSQQPELRVALADALDHWRLAVSADLELLLYAQRTTVVNAAAKMDRLG